jgi:hypothetical protein
LALLHLLLQINALKKQFDKSSAFQLDEDDATVNFERRGVMGSYVSDGFFNVPIGYGTDDLNTLHNVCASGRRKSRTVKLSRERLCRSDVSMVVEVAQNEMFNARFDFLVV